MGACFGRGDDAARRLRDAGESVFDDTPCPLALKEPKNGEYGLTIVGLVAPELIFFTDGREDLNQAGPFVIHSKTRWSGTRLITKWSTSELMGVSFEGHGYVRFRQTAGNRRWRSMPIPRRDGTPTRP